ncbi:MAG: hypothetical protein IJ834_05080 [Paludibacteraceae bacterium]|nr:hypothetical protein [Paludibacteraceae bacterium]
MVFALFCFCLIVKQWELLCIIGNEWEEVRNRPCPMYYLCTVFRENRTTSRLTVHCN